jgi:hypothetical protein
MVAKRHKIIYVPLFKKILDYHFMSNFSGHFEGASLWTI